MLQYTLEPYYDRAKSFYGKAFVIHRDEAITLYSYNTPVCEIRADGTFVRLWHGWSVTTARHVNEFRQQNGLEKIGKAQWLVL